MVVDGGDCTRRTPQTDLCCHNIDNHISEIACILGNVISGVYSKLPDDLVLPYIHSYLDKNGYVVSYEGEKRLCQSHYLLLSNSLEIAFHKDYIAQKKWHKFGLYKVSEPLNAATKTNDHKVKWIPQS